MVQGFIVITIVAVAILVGQSYPMLGGLIAMFPVKMFTYAFAANPDGAIEGMRGLFVGSLASTACATAMWFTVNYGMPTALGAGLAAWSIIALIGRFAS